MREEVARRRWHTAGRSRKLFTHTQNVASSRYWRLLSTDQAQAKEVVMASKPVIGDDTFMLEPAILDRLVSNVSMLSSVYHKLPEVFIKNARINEGEEFDSEEDDDSEDDDREDDEDEDEVEDHSGGDGEGVGDEPCANEGIAEVCVPLHFDFGGDSRPLDGECVG